MHPKRKLYSLPSIDFQVLCLFQGGYGFNKILEKMDVSPDIGYVGSGSQVAHQTPKITSVLEAADWNKTKVQIRDGNFWLFGSSITKTMINKSQAGFKQSCWILEDSLGTLFKVFQLTQAETGNVQETSTCNSSPQQIHPKSKKTKVVQLFSGLPSKSTLVFPVLVCSHGIHLGKRRRLCGQTCPPWANQPSFGHLLEMTN